MRFIRPLGSLFGAKTGAEFDDDPVSAAIDDAQLAHPLHSEDSGVTALAEKFLADGGAAGIASGEPAPVPIAAPPDAAAKPVIGLPHMSPAELCVLRRLLSSQCRRYLEFGSGGSTLLAARSGLDSIVAVESDVAWSRIIREHAEIAPLVAGGTACIIHADIGPTKAFGAPLSTDSLERWPSYIRLPWAEWARRGEMPDFVFVDGRFRVAAALSVIVAWYLSGRGQSFPIVAIHDVIQERPSYGKLWAFYDVVEEVETLRVLAVKSTINPMAVFAAFLSNQFDPA